MRTQDRECLIDHVLLVPLGLVDLPAFDQLDHPSWIEIDQETDAATVLREMLHGEAQPAGAGGAHRKPVAALGKRRVRQRVTEHLVVDAEVVDVDP